MKYDTIIIGGGLAGLVAGLRLIGQGQSVAVVSMGQSALHFNSGSLSLLGQYGGDDVVDPFDVMPLLPESHPYMKVGMGRIKDILPRIKPMFEDAGIRFHGSSDRNHYRLTPIGMFKPAWLTMEEYASTEDPDNTGWGKTLAVNISGFLDFYPTFIARGLQNVGVDCEVRHLTVPCLDILHRSSTEMRATNMARIINDDAVDRIAASLNRFMRESSARTVIMPAVFGLNDSRPVDRLRDMVDGRLMLVPTMPMSVGGMRMQIRLRERFRELGGAYLLGDKVSRGIFDGDRLVSVYTENFGYMKLSADNFIFAAGSFFGHGMESTPDSVVEPVFGLDVDAPAGRAGRCCDDLFSDQEYMSYGVVTDDALNVYRGGRRVENLYAVGSALSGCNSMKEGSGAGVAFVTAMKVADDILQQTKGGVLR